MNPMPRRHPLELPNQAPVPRWLEALRCEASRGRLARRCDLDTACHAVTGAGSCNACLTPGLVFLRALAEARGEPVSLRRPGSAARSFDEAWIERLILSIVAADWASTAFALRSRLPAHAHRRVRALASCIAAGLDRPSQRPTLSNVASQVQPAAKTCNKG